ncbi:winged helix-turn-helix transcriptional regulator [Larkinella terrae]|uniref:Transcriptional regulator n=1 Tax=Larkinella terrae TaxID=2025311 RepID=A0A7K0EHG5_9BACT|nr:helix-turn-helix domain-containing protein [Larkinella terrae]MRS61162.1 transcriptional regulator [Larkinella terrae]
MDRTIVDYQQDNLQKKLQKILQPTPGALDRCPIRNILDRFSDKWSTLSIFHLGDAGTLRFNELKKRIDGISQRMLTVTLRNLERDGLVTRRMYPEIPPRVEYELTDLGRSFLIKIIELGEWATNHSDQIIKARERYDRREQEAVLVEW